VQNHSADRAYLKSVASVSPPVADASGMLARIACVALDMHQDGVSWKTEMNG